MRTARTWNLHTHSRFSVNDALPTVEAIVTEAAGLGQVAIGLTDHGNMAGTVQLYKAAKKNGLLPFPGTELYVVPDRADKKAKRHHMCVVAYTTLGYENLVRLNSRAGANFFHKPLVDHADLAELAESGGLKGIAATSGCYFGLTAQAMAAGDTLGAELLLKTYAGWFDSFYVELQNHEIVHDDHWNDDLLADSLWGSATRLGLPCVLTQDAHYVHEEDKETHDGLKRLVAFGPDPDDALFPGDGFHLADDIWFRTHHHADRFGAGVAGLHDLVAKHTLTIPELDTYHYNIPFTVPDPQAVLVERTTLELAARGLAGEYLDRLTDELEIISDTGMAGYLLLVAEVTDWCVQARVFYQARGSASGSIVCWLLGITQADPVKHKLSFGRFISRDRTKPPDIDLDVESDRRGDLIAYLSGRFAVHQIGTWMEYSLAGDDEDAKGSLRVKYFAARGKKQRQEGLAVLDTGWDDVPGEDRRMLYRLSDLKPFASYGVHAAGLVVTTTADDFDRLVPTMKVASSSTYVTQYEMDDIESLGLVKLDVLGLKTLSVLHAAMDFLGRDVFEGLDWIPTRDEATFREIAKGHTAGVFQLEGFAAQRGVRELKPTKLADIIASMALFRPATMNSGATDSYIARKHGREKIPARHELLDRHTKATYGIFLFQEQVIAVLRDLGMDADDLTKFLKAVKASNSAIGNAGSVIDGYREWVWGAAIDAGFGRKDWEWFWESVTGFAAYGFNQAHSTAYGITAYRCAYLATHHPLEFHAALLKVAVGSKKEAEYVHAARRKGLRIAKANVNLSDISYTVVAGRRPRILRGLSAIKGIGPKAAAEIVAKRPEGGYDDLDDFCTRVDHRKITGTRAWLENRDNGVGTFRVLWEYGAFDSLTEEDE